MATVLNIRATSESSFQIGLTSSAILMKNSSGTLLFRNKADSSYINIQAANITGATIIGDQVKTNADSITLNQDALSSGADWSMLLARPASGMTASVTYTFPAAPSNGLFLQTDASGNLSWASPTVSGLDSKVTVAGLNISNASFASSPISMFTLPANAVVHRVEVMVATVFDAGSVQVGVSGTPGKFLSSGQSDLTSQDKFVGEPLVATSGSTQAVIVTLTGSPTAGAASILVHYSIPA